MEVIDRKFRFNAISSEHANFYTEREGVLFLAKDKLLPATLRFYRDLCASSGVDGRQLLGVDLLIQRVEKYQKENPAQLKFPDVDSGERGEEIIRPND